MISFNSIVFDDVKHVKTVPAIKKAECYELLKNGGLYMRTASGLRPLTIPNTEDRREIELLLDRSYHILVCGSDLKDVAEFRIFKTADWSLKTITVPSDFCRKKKYSLDDLNRKYLISTPTSKFLVAAHRKLSGKAEDSFILLGQSDRIYRLNCTYVKTEEDDDSIEVVSEQPFKTLSDSIDDYSLEIVEAQNFRFISENEVRSSVAREKIEGKRSLYLDVWKQYSDNQLSEMIDCISECGVLKIENIDKKSDRIYISVRQSAVFSRAAKEKNITDCFLLAPHNTDMKGEKFQKAISALREKIGEYKSSKDKSLIPEIVELVFENADFSKKFVELDTAMSVSSGKLVLIINDNTDGALNSEYICLSGYKIYHQIENQKKQFDEIMSANSPMPELADILLATDGSNEPDKKYRPKPRCFIDDNAAIGYFNTGIGEREQNKPTKSQIDALKVIARTPDIAVIWGPPGTGKTTLITAVLHAIESIDKPEYGTLLTTFQHVALDNLMEKTEVNGLPCLRYGGKDTEQSTLFSDPLLDKLKAKGDELAQKYPNYKKAEIFTKLEARNVQLSMMQLSYNNVLRFVQGVLNDCSDNVPLKDLKKLRDFYRKVQQKITVKTDRELIGAINNLRHSEVAYLDDGELLLEYLESRTKLLGLDILSPLLTEYRVAVNKSDFAQAEEVKRKMLVNLCSKKRCYLEKAEVDLLREILNEIMTDVKEELAQRAELEESVLAEYVSIFKNNFAEVVSVTKKYNKYSGVTHNQLDNRKVQRSLNNKKIFENVIIDEAARSSPLDLFVVMSRASNRIILVGDHCQLPQYTDRDSFRAAQDAVAAERRAEKDEEGYSSEELDTTDISLFQKLIGVAEKLRNNDGIERVVMLKEQFRMPSVLGNYVSKQFYSDKLLSDKSLDYKHAHGIKKYLGKSVIFKNIPSLSEGDYEQRDSKQSRYRQKEADWIAEDIKEILTGKNSGGLEIGIMSFYNAQCREINKRLVSSGIYRYADEHAEDCVLVDKYVEQKNTVYVGTVDSFQGRQFDIVYLSVTVSNNKANIGHLQNSNRLCVGMSRAKKLMIVAGDEKMLPHIKALEYYRQCCKNSAEGGVL